MDKPLILVCNDDGVNAPGIRALIEATRDLGKLLVVAPDKPQSGTGHGITINSTLRLNKLEEAENLEVYSCSGTPVDCIKLAIFKLLPKKPDIVISGINHGSNASINVIYSGTMSAAVEGSLEGVPSIGFSLLDFDINADFSASAIIARKITQQVLQSGLPNGICLNVNVPKLDHSEIMGIKICRQAEGNWEEEFEARTDPTGKEYFWLTGTFKNYDSGTDTDIWALENNYVSVVPIQHDLTAHNALNKLKDWNL
ncbi:MAG: 5'/3'-nucleotidase SurE [Crocinitomicaceae bacterium]|nr:5'/3'-nucleotidase SurE [Crocinitomicaceae bacterium]|tara:strand:- start:9406 stop:10170 length:765 start_codon:yes stop_codon:yes gene_type:complete